jgi:hypothetical protein
LSIQKGDSFVNEKVKYKKEKEEENGNETASCPNKLNGFYDG